MVGYSMLYSHSVMRIPGVVIKILLLPEVSLQVLYIHNQMGSYDLKIQHSLNIFLFMLFYSTYSRV